MHELPGLSYREYLSFSQGIQIPSFTLTDILDQNALWRSHLPANFRPLEHFRDYLAFGYHPFALEDKAGYHQRLQQMVRQVVEFDMAELQG